MSPNNAALVTPLAAPLSPGAQWQPVIGPEADAVVKGKLEGVVADAVLNAAVSILGRGAPPTNDRGSATGLVVGYVQSGKTLSFTTVIALARDNGFPIVVVVVGTSNPLLKQSTDRLMNDLKVEEFDGPPRWIACVEPAMEQRQTIEHVIAKWRDASIPTEEKPTLLITVKKQHHRLDSLTNLLDGLNLYGIPTLVVDDEADQASLNTRVRRQEESTTYQRLLALRRALPNHTFLQYTATPQAPLLINIIDVLSPSFVEVLEPGDGYVGGLQFFGGRRDLVSVIPPADIPSASNPLVEPPHSLLEALRIFFIGVAAGRIQGWSKKNPNRSMLVHPSRTTIQHFEYHQVIDGVKAEWVRILALPAQDFDRRDLIDDFQEAYQDVLQTFRDLPPFQNIENWLPRAMAETRTKEVNARAGKTPPIEWRQAYGWICVSGQAMDRGVTVRGLTVTYMPREVGTGNADTLQQRARFFGYKGDYLGLCRIYLETDVLVAFEAYSEHEEQMREELKAMSEAGRPLAEWKRRFILSPALNPCRTSVITHDYARGNYADQWFFTRGAMMSPDIIQANVATVRAFTETLTFIADTLYQTREPAQQHMVCANISLQTFLEDFLTLYRVLDAEDTGNILGLQLQLAKALEEHPTETVAMYQMRSNYRGFRSVDNEGRIRSLGALQQGPTRSTTPGQQYTYPGDEAFKDRTRVSVQLHVFDLRDQSGATVATAVPLIAVWVPHRLRRDWVVQNQ
jgi:hypothetical protein